MTRPRTPEQYKLIETRRRDGYTYRLYKNALGETRQTYEIGEPLATDHQIKQFIRSLRRKTAGLKNMVPNASGIAGKRGVTADPARCAEIIKDSGDLSLTIRQICEKHGISTKTYYKIVWAGK